MCKASAAIRMLRDHAERRLDKLLEQFEHLRPVGAVDRAVIEAAGDAHHGRDAQRIIDDIRPLLARTDREDHPLRRVRSEEHTSELQSLMRLSYAVFCLKKKQINEVKYTR